MSEEKKHGIEQAIEETAEFKETLDRLDNEDMIALEREEIDAPDQTLIITPADEVPKEEVQWLWYPYLPLGKLCLLGGDPGTGKTYVALSLATSFSRGKWPFLVEGQPSQTTAGNTLYCFSEDGIGDTLVQRLDDMGANLKRIKFFEGKKMGKPGLRRVLMNEEALMVKAITQAEARLVIFDPFQRFLPGDTKINDMESVSQVVWILIQIAKQTGATVLLLGHLNKSKHETLAYKFTGSIDWFAAARSALMVIPDPEDVKEGRYLYQIKNSLAPQAEGVQFRLRRQESPTFTWGKQTTVTAEAMVETSPGTRRRADKAKDFLLEALAAGEQESESLITQAKTQGISRNAMFEAKKAMQIHHRRDGISTRWLWFFPISGEG
jgi:RecA-family ATPase